MGFLRRQRRGTASDHDVPEPRGVSAREAQRALGDAAQTQLAGKLALLDAHLAKHAFFGGDAWNMADFMVASVLYTLAPIKHDLSEYPKLDAWLKASIERPAAKEARRLRE